MNQSSSTRSTILNLTVPLLTPLCIVLSLIVLYRGHNEPGGGFIGGLVCACGIVLIVMAHGVEAGRKALRMDPITVAAFGLLIALLGGLLPVATGDEFLTGLWLPAFSLPLLGKVHLGTPLIFDVGVYLTVIGFTMTVVFTLAELREPEQEPASAPSSSR